MTKDTASFSDLGLSACTLQAVKTLKYTSPTLIQAQSIPLLLEKNDLIGIAQTGTGKTAAFGLPMVEKIIKSKFDGTTKCLVLAPTRELAQQTGSVLSSIVEGAAAHESVKYAPKVVTIYGGAPITAQMKEVKSGADIIVATPGRIIDMIKRRAVNLEKLQMVALDEADEMLRMGFAEDVEEILSTTDSFNRQTVLFSATMPDAILKISQKYMNNPKTVKVSATSSTSKDIEQTYAVVPFSQKTVATHRLILSAKAKGIIIFTRTRATTDTVTAELMGLGISAAAISGDVPQKTRESIVKRLRSGLIRVLVATDVAARGLDVDTLELVINYDLPTEPELYVHRIGRTGRAGRKGKAISFVTPREVNSKLKVIEKLTKQTLTEQEIPTAAEVSKRLIKNHFDLIDERAHLGKLEHYVNAVEKRLEQVNTQEDLLHLIAASIALGLGDDGIAEEVVIDARSNRRSSDMSNRKSAGKYSTRGAKRDDKRGNRKANGREDTEKRHSIKKEDRRRNAKGESPGGKNHTKRTKSKQKEQKFNKNRGKRTGRR